MVCPFKRKTVTEVIYDYGIMVENRKPIKRITTIEFGECEHGNCPFFNPGYDTCSFKGVTQG